jgi:hypothetical protein
LLFLKPLGTFINMRPPEILVNAYLPFNPLFPQVLFGLFLYGYKAMTVQPLWINHAPASLFLRY